MATRSSSESRPSLSVATSNQIPKDVQGFDNPIPLSPQWLLPKPGESKAGIGTGENTPSSNLGNRLDILKSTGNGDEFYDTQKKKDVFRPSLLDMETGRRDRWRDEERDTNSSMRKDRWRDGDKELGDGHRNERWAENSSTRHYGDQRRPPSDRWTDSNNKDSNYEQRRDSKWNSKWGPDDKVAEGLREKWIDSGKDVNPNLDKRPSLVANHGREEKEGEIRPWRSSSAQGRGRGEPFGNQTSSNKQPPAYSYNRGRGENAPYTVSAGRGRVSSSGSTANSTYSSHSQSLGTASDRVESSPGDPLQLRYSRTKLIDVYKTTDLGANKLLGDGFVEVPSLTVSEPVEPLALFPPNSEELAVIKGIDKGDILSSGTPTVSKEGRGQVDSVQSRRARLGGKEDAPNTFEDSKDESAASLKGFREDGVTLRKSDERLSSRESTMPSMRENESAHPGNTWRSQSPSEPPRTESQGWKGTHESGWSHLQKNLSREWESNPVDPSLTKDGAKWQNNEDAVIRRQPSGVWDREQEARKAHQPSPEELQFCYVDPQGIIQGPFIGADIVGWLEAGYFGIDLKVRLAGASNDTPFVSLGDAMPHLKAKAKPPPGFAGPKQTEMSEAVSQMNFGGTNKLHVGLNDTDISRNESRLKQGSTTDAENKFFESLMSGNNLSSSSFAEGLQGYVGNNSHTMPLAGVDNLLAKRMALERQRSMTSPYTYWTGRDSGSLISKPETAPDPQIIPQMTDSSHPQSSELMSLLQGMPDRSSSGLNTNNLLGWPNLNVQGGPDVLQSKMDLRHDQTLPPQSPFGIPQQRPQQLQSQSSFPNLFPQVVDGTQGISMAEKLLPLNLPQDPQLLNMLQQQYLLLNHQAPVPSQQILVMEKLLLLQQQQKHEEQQLLLRQQQQQQQLLSQVISEHQNRQHLGELSFGQLQVGPAVPKGNASVDPRLQPLQAMRPSLAVPGVENEVSANLSNLPLLVSQDNNYSLSSESSFQLPHQKIWGVSETEQCRDPQQKELLPALVGSFPSPEDLNQSAEKSCGQTSISASDNFVSGTTLEPPQESSFSVKKSVMDLSPQDLTGVLGSAPLPKTSACQVPSSDPNDLKEAQSLGGVVEQKMDSVKLNEPSTGAEAKNAEVREPRKASEKKSKKQKSLKSQSSDQSKGVPKTLSVQQSKLGETENSIGLFKFESEAGIENPVSEDRTRFAGVDVVEPQSSQSENFWGPDIDTEPVYVEGDSKLVGSSAGQAQAARTWKPAPGFKAKSLLEIQQEEQKRAQTEMAVSEITTAVNSLSFSTPWAGVVANSDQKMSGLTQRDTGFTELNAGRSEISLNPKVKKSQLHDLLVEEVLAKSGSERDLDVSANASSITTVLSESVDDDNFIEAKETKKSRKKAAKAKGAGNKATALTTSVDVPVSSSPAKSSRPVQPEKDILPAIPSGPSLGDFVPWKGESSNPSPAPAWSTDSGKVPKATSLRDILKEQERKGSVQHVNQIPTPQKSQPAQPTRSTGPSWSLTGSSPTMAASPIQINSFASNSKHKGDDDLFWGPVEQTKQDTKQADFPNLSSQGSWGAKNNPLKGTSPGSLSRQKSVSNKHNDRILSSSPGSLHLSHRGKSDAMTKRSEALGFRDWCESECLRLVGSKDTSFVEFCLKQSRSEAESLLIENLGSYDPDHEFIEKFLNYKELLPADVLEIAFQSWNDQNATGFSVGETRSERAAVGDADADGPTKGGGKKKGKKGKKVSPSVLGFNVVSNRIMMGEIQTVED